ncbi:MAG: LytTR family DNA-binding domain-containing protein [Candidatus Pedobacter colombiensis]|uniref:LytTR family DNA-binding domain-containing protein n=1 Tax=Candidatus Pedobacter colombiensis TaxID=3121371 RepID=A0AAJ6B6T9_9SPHI|nr:LytTR family DNA-binding domain-containing protein [Pedobacter sp.]WEK19204.1 MAG: LytTR family DNA-binding domain-containing protein [Pedobacter sp.]
MNCLVVDDNIIALTIIKKLISIDPTLTVAGECFDAVEAYRQLQLNEIELLFLDIEMPDMNGIELVKSLGDKRPMVIITTSTADYAVEAFDLNVVDFLIKPIRPARFLLAVEKARKMMVVKSLALTDKEDEFVFIRESNVVRRLKISDILYMEARGDYVKINVPGHTYSIHSSLKSVGEKLSKNTFLRVHRSFIVNVSKIDTVEGGMLVINQNIVPVSDAYRAALYLRMQFL